MIVTLKSLLEDIGADMHTGTGKRPGRNHREILRHAAASGLIRRPAGGKGGRWQWDSEEDAEEIRKVTALLQRRGNTSWKGAPPPKGWRRATPY